MVPPGVVTTTLAVPAAWAGVVTVMDVALFTTRLVAAVPPMVTPVAPVKSVPIMVMLVPPATGPLVGEILVTVGAATMLATCTALPLVPPKDVTTAVRLPVGFGGFVKFTINCVVVAEVTLPTAPLLNVTVFILAVGTKFVPVIVKVVALIAIPPVFWVTVGVETATVGMLLREKGLVQPVAPCR